MSWEAFFGYLTCLRFVTTDMDLATILRTGFVVNVCNAIMCRLIAGNNRLEPNRWTALGFVLGFWAVAAVLLSSAARGSLGNHERGG